MGRRDHDRRRLDDQKAVAVTGEEFETAVRNATLSADMVAMQPHATEAARTRAIVRRTLEFLLANKIVEMKPASEWNEWMSLDPPFEMP